jgi:hypothetical protein
MKRVVFLAVVIAALLPNTAFASQQGFIAFTQGGSQCTAFFTLDDAGVTDEYRNCPAIGGALHLRFVRSPAGSYLHFDGHYGFPGPVKTFSPYVVNGVRYHVSVESLWHVADRDGDLMPDAVDPDDDNDGVADTGDNCQFAANAEQADQDGDAVGDACDPDIDGDGMANDGDNCRTVANPDQVDADNDGRGAACDTLELPLTKDDCKKEGWRSFDGSATFKNQGDCESFFTSGGKNLPAGS